MPVKIRQLRASLARAGFVERSAKGSHTFWFHPTYEDLKVTVSGQDGADAQKYQIKDVRNVLKRLEEKS